MGYPNYDDGQELFYCCSMTINWALDEECNTRQAGDVYPMPWDTTLQPNNLA